MVFKPGGRATGFPCPDCQYEGPNNIQRWLYDDKKQLIGVIISCHSCECVYELELN